MSRGTGRLPPEVNRILQVRNLPFKTTAEDMFELFGKYGAIRQIRVGHTADTKGTAFVVYEDIYDAKNACEHLSGYSLMGRYLIVLYYQPNKMHKRPDVERREQGLKELKEKYGV
ncbi:Splicing factor 3B subunit 6 [Blastocladiella emersonii ATCC 22665]|nr:Splicing factor 3B subunit 6 [Blastocladiella emersonii ATCC 22665]